MKRLPTPLGKQILIDAKYDPDRIGLIWMPPSAQNEVPSHGVVVAIGSEQDEIEVGFWVLVETKGYSPSKVWRDPDGFEYIFYEDKEAVAFVLPDGSDVWPRRNCVIVRPNWDQSGPVKHGRVFLINRIFEGKPEPPKTGIVHKVGSLVSSVTRGQTIIIPRSGGHELAVKDRVVYSLEESLIPGILVDADDNDSTKGNRRRRKTATGLR